MVTFSIFNMQTINIKSIPKTLIEIIGEDKLKSFPYYQINNSLFGPCKDYPDFIRYDDVTDPIMIGVDQYNRTFIVFKLQIILPNKSLNITEVLFQRHSNTTFWTSASNPRGMCGLMSNIEENYEQLNTLLKDGRINNMYESNDGLVGDYILG